MATNYSKGKVYKLVNNVDNEIYVGSTIQSLTQRKAGHKRKAVDVPNRRVYQHLNTIGWDNVEIVLIENYPCESKDELNARERYWVEELNPSLNKYFPLRTQKEYRQVNADFLKEWSREYRQKNADKIKENKREYYQQNVDKIKEKNREYRHQNVDKIKEYKCDYQKQNVDKIKEYKREYYQQNAGKVKEKQREYRQQNADKVKEINRQYYLRKKAEREAQE